MNVLDSIGSTLTKIVSGKDENKLAIDKNSILLMIDNSLGAVNQIITTVKEDYLTTYINRNPKSVNNEAFKKAYFAYLKATGSRGEPAGYFSELIKVAPNLRADLELIRDNFESIFTNGTNASDIELEQMRTSHAAVMGFIDSVQRLCNWYVYMISLVELPGDLESIPKYREVFVVNNAASVGSLIKYINFRGRRTILDEVAAIKSGGNDVFLIANGTTVNHYSNINDFDQPAQNFLGAFDIFVSGFVFISQTFSNIHRMFYEHNKSMHDWMITKQAMIQMSLEGKDPDSMDYMRKEKLLKDYSNLITIYARKIAEYEGDA